MKVVKVKYYEETEEIIPLDPQPTVRVNGRLEYDRSGTDEKGDYVVIDFISEDPVYFDYEAKDEGGSAFEFKVTTEEEWSKPAETLDIESTDLMLSENAPIVDVNTLEKSSTTSTEMSQAISRTVIVSMMQTIKRLYLNVLDVIVSIFRK